MTQVGDCGIRGPLRGKNQILLNVIKPIDQSLPWVAVGSPFTAGLYRLLHENKRERFQAFNGVYRFLHSQMSSWRTNKAIILRWDGSDRLFDELKDNPKLKTARLVLACVPDHCHVDQTRSSRGKDGAAGAVGISRFISNISGFIPSRVFLDLK